MIPSKEDRAARALEYFHQGYLLLLQMSAA